MANDAVEQIKDRLDIVDVIGQRVQLRKAGRSFKGLCPFHQEKTPSFIVFPDSQTFHCFGCHAGGDLFNYVMQQERIDFAEALRTLASQAGVEIEERAPADHAPAEDQFAHLYDLNQRATSFFSHVLWRTTHGEAGRQLLEERGVEVVGRPTTDPPEHPLVARLARVSSATVADLLTFTVQRSDNHLADQLFHVIGRVRTGEGSWEHGGRALHQVLERFGVEHEEAVFADGSGLSRDDRVTARLLVELDLALTSSPRFSGPWRTFHAVAGETGTLRTRLAGTPAAGRFLGKTGTLRDVTAVSGQVLAADADAAGPALPRPRRYHVAVLANDADGVQRGIARAAMDEIVLALTADLDGCRIEQAGTAEGPLGRPPSAVVCRD
jgi:D-alanyl-D-alanine carboxypeptidase